MSGYDDMYKYVIKTFKKIEIAWASVKIVSRNRLVLIIILNSHQEKTMQLLQQVFRICKNQKKSEQTGMLQKQVPARIIHVKRKRLPKKDNVVRICLVDQLILRTA